MSLTSLRRAWWPFWQFKDTTQGDLYARAAAHRHNLQLRASLPRYLLRWLSVCGVASAMLRACDALAADVGHKLDVFVVMAAGSGLICAYAACAVFIIGYAYLYLVQAAHGAGRP